MRLVAPRLLVLIGLLVSAPAPVGAQLCDGQPDGTPCEDGVFCNGADSCLGGVCEHAGDPCLGGVECANACDEVGDTCFAAPGTPCTDDANPCTTDVCDGAGTCGVANAAPCDDGLFCNGNDVCSGGACTHGGDPCAAGGVCANACDEAGDTCLAPPGTPCTSDGNPCTDDVCDGAGGCGVPNTAPCDDGLFCNGTDTCGGGSCLHSGDPCGAGPECDDTCNEVADSCLVPAGTGCTDDGNPCTDDRCDGSGACVHPPNAASCDDGLFCNGADVCAAGTCTHGGNPCAGGPECANVCNEAADSCFLGPGTPCSPDGNPCTDDACNGAGTCGVQNTGPCDDGVFCNGTDACAAGACVHAGNPCAGRPECANLCSEALAQCVNPPGACDDGNPCTADVCTSVTGTCSHPAAGNGTPCDDGDTCTRDDGCAGGTCAGTAVAGCCTSVAACDDGIPCTADACTAQLCVNVADHTRCGATGDCIAVACAPDDAAADAQGCVARVTADDTFCSEDGDPCTEDTCRTGSCLHLDDGSGEKCPALAKPFETARRLVEQASTLRGAVAPLATCAEGAGPTCGSATTEAVRSRLLTLLVQVHGEVQAAALALGGRLAAPGAVEPSRDPVLRARLAQGLVAESPTALRGFLASLKQGRRQGVVTRGFARDRRMEGRKLLAGARKLQAQLRRILMRRQTFAR